jgi:hypothetical protein
MVFNARGRGGRRHLETGKGRLQVVTVSSRDDTGASSKAVRMTRQTTRRSHEL